jgi:hypothetical protein
MSFITLGNMMIMFCATLGNTVIALFKTAGKQCNVLYSFGQSDN